MTPEEQTCYDALRSRLAEAEALANEVLTPWPSGRMADGSVIVSPTLVQKFRVFLASDSAKPVCEACGGTGKAYLLHSRAERPCPMCSADQPGEAGK